MRKELEARPFVLLAAGIALGLTASSHPGHLLLVPVLLLFLRGVGPWSALLIGLTVGFLRTPAPTVPLLERTFVNGPALVASVPRLYPDQLSCEVETGGRRLLLIARGCPDLVLGDRLAVMGVAKPLRDGADSFLLLKGIEGRLEPVRLERTERGAGIYRLADAWRRDFVSLTDRYLPKRVAAVVQALAFNLDTRLDDVTEDRLRATGTVHIVSVSGLHVFVIAAATMFALSMLPLPRPWQIGLLALILGLYAIATGMNVPTLRAMGMGLLGLAAYLFRREPDVPSALAAMAVGSLLWRPNAIFEPGFQLSFLTVAGLALFAPSGLDVADGLRPWLKHRGVEVLRVSLVAGIFSAPIVAYHFGELPLLWIPANLLIAAVVAPIVVGSLLSQPIAALFPPLGVGILVLIGTLAGWVLWVVDALGSLPGSTVSLPGFSAYLLVPLYGAMLLMWRPRVRRP